MTSRHKHNHSRRDFLQAAVAAGTTLPLAGNWTATEAAEKTRDLLSVQQQRDVELLERKCFYDKLIKGKGRNAKMATLCQVALEARARYWCGTE